MIDDSSGRKPVEKTSQQYLEEMLGKVVFIECESHGEKGKANVLYWGNYKGLCKIGKNEVLVLEDVHHYNRAGIAWPERPWEKEDYLKGSSGRIHSERCFISTKYIISIDQDRIWPKQEDEQTKEE